MKNFVQNLMILSAITSLCACSAPRFPTLIQENQQAQAEKDNNIQTTQFNSFIEQKVSIYREQYQQIKNDYQKLSLQNNKDNQEDIKNLEQKISVLTDALGYSLNDKRATNEDKTALRSLRRDCNNLLAKIKQKNNLTANTAAAPQADTSNQSDILPTTTAFSAQSAAPLFGTKASLEGENLLTSGKKPALVIKAATEYETALSTIVKATANAQNQTAIDIINLTTPQESSQTSQLAYAIYKEIISMGMDEGKVSLTQKTDSSINESAILIYTR